MASINTYLMALRVVAELRKRYMGKFKDENDGDTAARIVEFLNAGTNVEDRVEAIEIAQMTPHRATIDTFIVSAEHILSWRPESKKVLTPVKEVVPVPSHPGKKTGKKTTKKKTTKKTTTKKGKFF